MKTIQVGVVCRIPNVGVDIILYEMASGDHIASAKERVRQSGYEPVVVFDENDPAWSFFKEQAADAQGFWLDESPSSCFARPQMPVFS